jgi:hypothetical protein
MKKILHSHLCGWTLLACVLVAFAGCKKEDPIVFIPGPSPGDGFSIIERQKVSGTPLIRKTASDTSVFPFYYESGGSNNQRLLGRKTQDGTLWEKNSTMSSAQLLTISSPNTDINDALLAFGTFSHGTISNPGPFDWIFEVHSPSGELLTRKQIPPIFPGYRMNTVNQIPISPREIQSYFSAQGVNTSGFDFDFEVFMATCVSFPHPPQIFFFGVQYQPTVEIIELPQWVRAPAVSLSDPRNPQPISRITLEKRTPAAGPLITDCSNQSGTWQEDLPGFMSGASKQSPLGSTLHISRLELSVETKYGINQCNLSALEFKLSPAVRWTKNLPVVNTVLYREDIIIEAGTSPDFYAIVCPQGPFRFQVFKLDAAGNVLWDNTYPLHDFSFTLTPGTTISDDTHLWLCGALNKNNKSKGYMARIDKQTGAFVTHRTFEEGPLWRTITHLAADETHIHGWGRGELNKSWYFMFNKASF